MQTNACHTFRAKMVDEIRRLSSTKSELYTLAFMNCDQPLNRADMHLAENCVGSMNESLRTLVSLYQYGKEHNMDKVSQDTHLHMIIVHNYINGYFDKDYAKLCSFTNTKIMPSTVASAELQKFKP